MPNALELKSGDRFGKLVIIKRDENKPKGSVFWLCQCDCGNEDLYSARATALYNGQTWHCDKCERPRNRDLIGKTFGKLLVVQRDIGRSQKTKKSYWLCRCSCGNEELYSARADGLISGQTTHCNKCKRHQIKGIEDLTNQRFGRLLVLERDFTDTNLSNRSTRWKCLCDCGNIVTIDKQSLKKGATQSCGCYQNEIRKQSNNKIILNLTNQRFGKLTAIENTGNLDPKTKTYLWRCKCDCGNEKITSVALLKAGHCLSCGQCSFKSQGEHKIMQILKENSINFISEYKFTDLINIHPLRYDFAIIDTNNNVIRLIEFDGEQHFSDKFFNNERDNLEKRQYRDNLKNKYAKNNQIPLVRIPYYDINKITIDSLLGDEYLI